ncbi:Uncharacterised protein [Vibrio cholerae]|nr:Uncharacterised protein [Vibrio cholerae]
MVKVKSGITLTLTIGGSSTIIEGACTRALSRQSSICCQSASPSTSSKPSVVWISAFNTA